MNHISFQPERWNGTHLSISVGTDGSEEKLNFVFDEVIPLEEDSLAIALSTLCGTRFDRIDFGFPVSSSVVSGIAEWTGSDVQASGSLDFIPNKKDGSNAVLNFSGGLDSLASKFLLGDCELVSLDFGGRFSRERNFFQQFDTRIIETNIVTTGLRSNSWSFMGIGPLLLANCFESPYFAFGSILEASQLRLNAPASAAHTFPPFKLAGYESVAPVAGISEVGTVLLVLRHNPDLLSKSLLSLASPGEEKYFRKIALAQLVDDIFGFGIDAPPLPTSQKVHYKFGQNFAVDLTALLLFAYGRTEQAEALVSGVPTEISSQLSAGDFDFMFKTDPRFYEQYPDALRGPLEDGLRRGGLGWYSSRDYESVSKIREILTGYYAF